MKKRLRVFLIIVGSLVLMGLLLIVPVDNQDFKTTDFYHSTMNRLDSVEQELVQQPPGKLSVGWGAANITPDPPVRLTGRSWTPFEQVFDSVYVRVYIFSTGSQRVAVLNYDLWIIHPHLAAAIRRKVMNASLRITGVYFTANHSHTSIGGWANGLLGSLIIGGNSVTTVKFLEDQTMKALMKADENSSPTTVGYGEVLTTGMIVNRLDTAGKLDEQLRMLKLRQSTGDQAILTTYSSHSVYMNKDINTLSADYSGGFLQKVQALEGIDFASFAPGATASHTPIGRKPFTRKKMDAYSQKLADYLEDKHQNISLDSTKILKFVEWPVDMRSPHFRIANHWRLRPWLFHKVMGREEASITAMRVGNTILVALPVELSGEFYEDFQEVCQSRGFNLMITTFNGSYLGYANPEKYYYTLKRAETREMNWYGPQAGEYYVNLINELLTII